jgi:type IV secretory pathway VirB4 component
VSIFVKSKKKASSRHQIAIEGVQDGILILPNNHYRAVLQISSINFELKSEAEQDALIDTYQSFLNSLATSLQIVVRIREMDMDRYITDVQARLKDETDDIYRSQIKNYSEFVQSLITSNKILTRNFYVILPIASTEKDFELIKEQLSLNADIVAKGLARLGMQSRQLNSLEILDLFYGFYAPAQAKRQPLSTQTLQVLKEGYL